MHGLQVILQEEGGAGRTTEERGILRLELRCAQVRIGQGLLHGAQSKQAVRRGGAQGEGFKFIAVWVAPFAPEGRRHVEVFDRAGDLDRAGLVSSGEIPRSDAGAQLAQAG